MIVASAFLLGLAAPAFACDQTSMRSDASPIVLAQASPSTQGGMAQPGNGQGGMAQQGQGGTGTSQKSGEGGGWVGNQGSTWGQKSPAQAQKAGEGGGNWVGNQGSSFGNTQH
jgi:hypothetical protein